MGITHLGDELLTDPRQILQADELKLWIETRVLKALNVLDAARTMATIVKQLWTKDSNLNKLAKRFFVAP